MRKDFLKFFLFISAFFLLHSHYSPLFYFTVHVRPCVCVCEMSCHPIFIDLTMEVWRMKSRRARHQTMAINLYATINVCVAVGLRQTKDLVRPTALNDSSLNLDIVISPYSKVLSYSSCYQTVLPSKYLSSLLIIYYYYWCFICQKCNCVNILSLQQSILRFLGI